jgi:acetyltransferase
MLSRNIAVDRLCTMSIRNLHFLFQPASVALLGASDQSPGGAVLLRNLCNAGFTGEIFLVSRETSTLQDRPVYRQLSRLPHAPELAIIATPTEAVAELIGKLGACGTRAVVIVSPPAADWPTQRQAMLQAARPHLLRIIGPACHGVLVPGSGLNIGFSPVQPAPGTIAFIAQSGAVMLAVLDWAYPRGIGFSHGVALGGMVDVDGGDLLDYLTDDAHTRAILLYLKSITQARKFMSAARAAARVKPVIILKAGRQADAVYDAAFRRAGMLRVRDLRELFGAVETLALAEPVHGDRFAILGNGGIGSLVADGLLSEGGNLARLSANTLARLNQVLPPHGPQGNPVDILEDAPGNCYAAALAGLLQDPGVDAVLVVHGPTALVAPTEVAQAVIDTVNQQRAHGSSKPGVFTCWLGDHSVQAARRLFTACGIPTYDTPSEAVHACMDRVRYRRNQETLMQTPPTASTTFTPDLAAARRVVAQALAEGRSQLTEIEAQSLLYAYQIPVVLTQVAASPEEAARIAATLGVPVSLKIQAANIRHKSDVKGVALELETPAVVQENAAVMWARIGRDYPDTHRLGFTVQPMVHRPNAHELLAGVLEDPLFGPVIVFGHGGPAAEVIDDKALALPPLNLHLAQEVMARTRLYPLLRGYQEVPAVDLDAIALTLVKLSQLVIDIAEIVELDINPLLADEQGVVALGTRIKVARSTVPASQRLAIRPYPQELEECIILPDGRRFLLRPVRPEDEPAFQAAFARLSAEEIRMRFLHPVKGLTHAAAARLTQIDYDREMALVLTRQVEDSSAAIYGVVRLVADPDKERAEFAIIVGQGVTGLGFGPLLLRRIISYARRQGIKEIFGDVLRENRRMLKLAQALGFVAVPSLDDPTVLRVSLQL